jgi:hypothetical protein
MTSEAEQVVSSNKPASTSANAKEKPDVMKFIKEQRERLKQQRASQSKFFKFDEKTGMRKILRFEPMMGESDVTITNKEGKVIATGQWRFWASQLIDDDWTELKEWVCAPKWGDQVYMLFERGEFTLDITRIGTDKNGTNYIIVPYRE